MLQRMELLDAHTRHPPLNRHPQVGAGQKLRPLLLAAITSASARSAADGRDHPRFGRSRALLCAAVWQRQGSRELRGKMVAANALSGDMPLLHWDLATNGCLLDVRELSETVAEEGPEAPNILVGKLRSRLGELLRDREIHVYCRSGQCFYITQSFFRTDLRPGTSQAECSFWRTGAK